MYTKTLFFASYEIIVSIIFGLLTIFAVHKIVDKIFLRKISSDGALKNNNIAVGIFSGTVIVCVLILVQSSVLPSVEAMRTMVITRAKISIGIVGLSLLYFLLFYVVSLIISLIVILSAIGIYMKATRHIDEMEEIRDNNISIGIVLSLVLLGATLFLRAPVKRFISSLINYEAIERSYVNRNSNNQNNTQNNSSQNQNNQESTNTNTTGSNPNKNQ